MKKAFRSLQLKVVGYLLAAQILSFSLGWVVATFLHVSSQGDLYAFLDSLAYFRCLDLVKASVIDDEKGRPHIEPSAGLRSESNENPQFIFAVFDPVKDELLRGSARELLSAFTRQSDIRAMRMDFVLDRREGYGYVQSVDTPAGRFRIALYGYKFRFADIFHAFWEESAEHIYYLYTPLFLSVGIVWLAVRNSLGSLRPAIDEVESIDFGSLKPGIVAKDAPTEIRPFIDAVNAALARLEASAKRMRRYTANAAHELRTPLAILRARLEDTEEPTFKNDLKRDVSRLQAIVEQLLITARLSEQQVSLDEEIELVNSIRQIVADYLPLALDCGRKLEFEAGTAAILVRGNRRAIECVVANLVDNALRAEPPGGTVSIKVAAPASIEVVDHGEGVALGDREQIFEPFWRKHEASPGTGLGLGIAKELMDRLEGRIWVEETPGGGATFKVAFQQL
jgi:two-component system, OmpR family, sensor kinase